jgi:sulfate adenylyltransferase subunit 1
VLTSDADLKLSSTLTTTILWMDDEALMSGKNFLVKIGTKLIPGVVTKIHYSIDVNTGEQKNAAILNKNEIAVCTLTLSEQIVVDEFSKHKTLGELILIDRITNMTSACGVVTYIKQSQEGEKSQVVDRQSRSVLKGQVSVAVEFQAGKNGFSREFVEKTERQLASAGRHTYLYQPQQGEQYDKTVRHLVDAGIIVLLYLDANVAVNRALRNENFYYYEWDSNAGSDLDAVVDKVKKLSSFTTYISGNGDYTI